MHPQLDFETKILEKLKLAAITRITRQQLHGLRDAEVDSMVDLMVDQLMIKLQASVYSDPSISHKETVTITERNAHPTWKHAKIASLPLDSFRRRFWSRFWEIDEDYQNTTVEHRVSVYVPAVLPEMQRQFPDDFGRVMFPISITKNAYTR